MKKVLIVASVISFIEWFNRDNIRYLTEELGCEVHIACNTDYMEDTDVKRTKEYLETLRQSGVVLHPIAFARSPLSPGNIGAYRALRRIIRSQRFDLIHCHTPTASILTRLAAAKSRKTGTKVVYTAHGYHFFHGAPLKNWLMFYPIEKFCSRFTDVLITITEEDFALSKHRMKAKEVVYVPGVGVDIDRFAYTDTRAQKRKEEGIEEDEFVLFSVGELNENKNHETVIRALAQAGKTDIRYRVAGKGPKADELIALAGKLGVKLDLLGFRKDIPDLIGMADAFAFPSHREGLSKALMEAMAAGLPCVVSKIRGNVDLIDERGGYLCDSHDPSTFANAITALYADRDAGRAMGAYNTEKVKKFSKQTVNDRMFELYRSILEN